MGTVGSTISSSAINSNSSFSIVAGSGTTVSIEVNSSNTWQSATLVNSWANYGSGYANAGYRKMPDGSIRLRGLVSVAGNPTTTIFTLPSGHRPPSQLIFSAWAGGGNVRIDVAAGGGVSVVSYGSGADSSFVSLAGISFDTM